MGVALETGFDASDALGRLDNLSRGRLRRLTRDALALLGTAVAANAKSEQIIRGNRGAGKYKAPTNPLKITSRSGDLRRSIVSELESGSLAVRIGSDYPYAAVHEYGIDKNVSVKAHKRTVAWGRETAPFNVKQFNRMMKVKARPYLAPALRAEQKKWDDFFARVWARESF